MPYYLAHTNINIGTEIENPVIVQKLEYVYNYEQEGLPVYEVQLLGKIEKVSSVNGCFAVKGLVRILKQISDKELRKALEKQYKKLDIAIMFNDLSSVKKIYNLKTPVKRSSDYSFAYAVKTGNLNIVKYIFEQGEIDLESYYTKECLEIAVEEGYLDIVKYLIKIGLNPCDRQFYPLIWARKKGYEEIISFLEKDIKKRLGKLPEIQDPYEILIEKKKIELVSEKVKEEFIEKPTGRGVIETKIKKSNKPKSEKKKKILSLEELKKKSKLLLTNNKTLSKVKSDKKDINKKGKKK